MPRFLDILVSTHFILCDRSLDTGLPSCCQRVGKSPPPGSHFLSLLGMEIRQKQTKKQTKLYQADDMMSLLRKI